MNIRFSARLVTLIAAGLVIASAQGGTTISDPARVDRVVTRCLSSLGRRPVLTDAEVHAVADPRDPDHLVAAWQMLAGPNGVIQAATSFDGGNTWSAPRPLPVSSCAGGPAEARRASDSWVAIGPAGDVYVAAIGWNEGSGGDSYSGLVVTRSSDGGRTWGQGSVAARGDAARGVSFDNVSIVADHSKPGTVYLATTRYAPAVDSAGRSRHAGPIGFTRSTDGGSTWSPMAIVGQVVPGGRVSAPQLLIDPTDGRLMVFYFRSAGEKRIIGWQTSSDGGTTWEAEREITPAIPARWVLDSVRPPASFVLAGDIVHAAVDPATGSLFVAYPDGRRDPGGRLGVSLVASFDRGVTWTAPFPVSPDGAVTGWLPSVSIGAQDRIGVAYLTANFAVPRDSIVIRYNIRELAKGPGNTLVSMHDGQVDQSPLAWPGDYHSLVSVKAGFRLITVRATSVGGNNPTDVVVRGGATR